MFNNTINEYNNFLNINFKLPSTELPEIKIKNINIMSMTSKNSTIEINLFTTNTVNIYAGYYFFIVFSINLSFIKNVNLVINYNTIVKSQTQPCLSNIAKFLIPYDIDLYKSVYITFDFIKNNFIGSENIKIFFNNNNNNQLTKDYIFNIGFY